MGSHTSAIFLAPARWRTLEPFFDAARELPAARRAAFLDEAFPGDATMRAELETLLAEAERPMPFLDHDAAEQFAAMLAEPAPPVVPNRLGDRYEIEREIGRGGMATVFLARDVKHARQVAIKVLDPTLAAALGPARFLTEIRTTANLQHPHIVPLFDSGEVDGRPYYVMPYLSGESLRARLLREGRLPIADVLRIAREVASALDCAHAHGIVHRDIKPENILLHEGQAFVTDFGIALAASAANGTRLTRDGVSVGTPEYMSPEQLTGRQAITPASDIWSLGAVVYEMLTGEPPFARQMAVAMAGGPTAAAPPSVRQVRSEVPDTADRAIRRALSPAPSGRFATAAEFVTRLDSAPDAVISPQAPIDPACTGADAILGSSGSAPQWRRIRQLMLSAGAIVVTVGIALAALRARPPALDPNIVLVDVLMNETGDSALAPLGIMAADWIERGLDQTGAVRVQTTYYQLNGVRESPDAASRKSVLPLARATRAATVIRGRYYRVGDRIAFQVDLTDLRSGDVVHVIGPVESSLAHPEEAVAGLRSEVMGLMAATYDPRFNSYAREGAPPPSLEAYQVYVAAIGAPTLRLAIAGYAHAAELAPRWELPRLHESFARWGLDDFRGADSVLALLDNLGIPLSPLGAVLHEIMSGELHDDIPSAEEAARRWATRAPTSFSGVHLLVDVLARRNRPHEVIDAIHRFDWRNAPLWARDGPVAYELAALHLAADYQGELRDAGDRDQTPGEVGWLPFLLASESRALAALGRARELDAVFDRVGAIGPASDTLAGAVMLAAAEELVGHGHPGDAPVVLQRALRWFQTRRDTSRQPRFEALYARALYESGRLGDAAAIASRLLQRDSTGSAAPWVLLGTIAAHRGDSAEARRIAAHLATAPLNDLRDHLEVAQAKIAMALGDRDAAMMHLGRACGRGCDSFLTFLENDFDLLPLHGDPRFIELLRPKG